MKSMYYFFSTLVMALTLNIANAQLEWVGFSGNVPSNAVIGGSEESRNLPVCRCQYNGNTIPGKVVSNQCNISLGGKEYEIKTFEVLVNKGGAEYSWGKLSGNTLPPNAFAGGKEGQNTLYVGRANYTEAGVNKGMQPGKVVPMADGTYNFYFGYAGNENETRNFEVLLVNQNKAINYGDVITLQNGWNNYGGGFLDTRGYQKDYEKTGNFLCVSTALSATRDGKSGSWKVMSAKGKANGSPVLIGDEVYLQNQWNGNGGFLDTRGYQKDYEITGNHLCVSTATSSNREAESGTWKIISATGSPAGTPLTGNAEIHLQNGWNKFQGGYLDTRGYQKDYEQTGNHLCVSTATSQTRDGKSGTWKISKP